MDFNSLFGTPAQQAAQLAPIDAGLFPGCELRKLIGHRYVDGFARLIAAPFWLADPRVLMGLAHSAKLGLSAAEQAEQQHQGTTLTDEQIAGRLIGHLGRIGLGVQQVVFLGSDEAEATAARISAAHATVKGTLGADFGPNYPADTPYYARDPELCDWVNGWYLYGLLQAAPALGLTIEDPDGLYDQAQWLFEFFGSSDLPPTLEAFKEWLMESALRRAAVGPDTLRVANLFLSASLEDALLPSGRTWVEIVLQLVGPVGRGAYQLDDAWTARRDQDAQEAIARLAKRLSEQPADAADTQLRTLQLY